MLTQCHSVTSSQGHCLTSSHCPIVIKLNETWPDACSMMEPPLDLGGVWVWVGRMCSESTNVVPWEDSLQEVTGGFRRSQGAAGDHRWLQVVT